MAVTSLSRIDATLLIHVLVIANCMENVVCLFFQSITRSAHAQQRVDEQRVLGLVLPLDDDDAATDDAIQCRADTDQS